MHPALVWREDPAQKDRMVRVALYFASRGVPVVPYHRPKEADDGTLVCSCRKAGECGSPAKHPKSKAGIKDATRDLDRIRKLWERDPFANVGLATGDIGVLDYDSPEAMQQLLQDNPVLGRTTGFIVRTPRGGYHQYFGLTEGGMQTRHFENLDYLRDGGGVQAPGSQGINGRIYTRLFQWRAFDTRPLAEQLAPVPTRTLERMDEMVAEREARVAARRAEALAVAHLVDGPRRRGWRPLTGEEFLSNGCNMLMTLGPMMGRNNALLRIAGAQFVRMRFEGDIDSTTICNALRDTALSIDGKGGYMSAREVDGVLQKSLNWAMSPGIVDTRAGHRGRSTSLAG